MVSTILGLEATFLVGFCMYVRGGEDGKGLSFIRCSTTKCFGSFIVCLYVNDLPTVAPESGSTIKYADDTQALVSGSLHDLAGIISRLPGLLQRFHVWLIRNRLSLHIAKSQVSLFGSTVILRHIDLKSIQMFDVTVPIKPTLISLSVTLDICLT